ncbi:hypothetical protein M885DRAFT_518665, partial [Pelagophyceae sp. CCMP2097]
MARFALGAVLAVRRVADAARLWRVCCRRRVHRGRRLLRSIALGRSFPTRGGFSALEVGLSLVRARLASRTEAR